MDLSMENELFLKEIGVGIRPINDKFFNESYDVCKVFQRTGITVEDDEELCHQVMDDFSCNALGCTAIFANLLDFELHYNSAHRFTCGECKKIKTNARLLEIHIEETHDSFFKASAEKKAMYQCYVSDCDLKFMNNEERRNHCITIHKFSKHFKHDEKSMAKTKLPNFMEIDSVNDHRKKPMANLYKNQRIKTFDIRFKNNSKPLANTIASSLPKATSTLAFIPRQLIHKSYTKLLTQDKSMETNVLESSNMMDMMDALSQ